MKLETSININDLPESEGGSFDPLPAGWYSVTINKVELKPTKAGDGSYLSIQYGVTGPSHQGRVVFGNLTMRNANETAQKIGHEQLRALMAATGLKAVEDTDQFLGKSLEIKLKIRPARGEWEASNDVSAFRASSGPAASAPAGGGGNVPWAHFGS